MKKSYKTVKTFIVLLCLIAAQMGAQLNGVYTINNTLPVSSTNYTSFTSFANDLGAQGVSGPVTVNVGGTGPYVEQPLFGTISGVSSANRVTINGNNYLLTFSSSNSSLRHTMGFNGADYITVNNLQMEGTGTYQYVAQFYNGANYNTFNNCTFSVTANTTTSNHIPVVMSGAASTYASYGTGGNYNVFNGCTMFSGYWGISIYGNTTSPYVRGNEFNDCVIRDWYQYGVYINAYTSSHKLRNNNISNPTRTTITSPYGIYCYGTQDLMCDGNWIHDLFAPSMIGSGNTAIGIYVYYNLMSSYTGQQYPSSMPNIIRNNLITDIKHNGSVYGIYAYYFDGYVYNNTISLDYAGATSGTTYGIYGYGYPANYVFHCKNNIVTITRGGSGTKWCYYNVSGISSSTDLPCDRNDFYIASAGGTNYVGFYTGSSASNLAAFQAQGANTTGFSVDPAYVALGSDYHPTNAAINNTAIPMQLVVDQQKMPRSGTTPDIGALEFLSAPCSGTPNPGSVVSPTYNLCPGESADLILSNFSSDLGLTYQWGAGTTSTVGPFVSIPSATSVLYTAPNLTTTTYFQVTVTCTNSSQFVNVVGVVNVVGTTTSTVPYFEGFEGISAGNKLPNCSWSAPTIGGGAYTYTSANNQNRVPRTGSKFASFYYTPSGVQKFYTNGIWMEPGITYSASVWYTTEYYGYSNWTNFSLILGPSQSATGQQTIATTGGPAISNIYKSLSNTFTVATPGLYFVEIRSTSSGACCGYYLSWDDLKIEIPCSVNSPTMSVSASSSTVCANSGNVTLNASGAGSYSWSTGDQGQSVVVTPTTTGQQTYYVTGTNTLTGCTVTLPQNVTAYPTPELNVFANPPSVCSGAPVNLYAFGAQTYAWSTNDQTNVVTVTPVQTGTYAVQGTNQYGCKADAVIQVNVNQAPVITAQAPTQICVGETHTITANGGVSYQMVSPGSFNTTNPAMVTPMSSTQYTIYGTDANGCVGETMVTIAVDACTGLRENGSASSLRVYPNPTSGLFTVELNNGAESVEVVDVTGRVVIAEKAASSKVELNIGNLANGVYSVKVKTEGTVETIRIIKN